MPSGLPCIFLVPDHRGVPGDTVCGEPSAGVVRSVCVHEHIGRDHPVCPACAVGLQFLAGTIICGPCERGPAPHECLARVVIEWDEGYQEPEPVTLVQEAA